MKIGANTNINFTGAVVTKHGDDFGPVILTAKYDQRDAGGNWRIPLDVQDHFISETPKEGNVLILWDNDCDMLSQFAKTHANDIPASPQRYTKLANAVLQVANIPEALTKEAVGAFTSIPENLSQTLLTPQILEKALRLIKNVAK
jgi:hypothetical protein